MLLNRSPQSIFFIEVYYNMSHSTTSLQYLSSIPDENEVIASKPHQYGIKIRLFLDNSGNQQIEPFLEYLEEKKFIINRYTYGIETSLKSHRKHYHLHIEVLTHEKWCQKTPIQQTFKNWQKSKGIPYAKSALSFKIEEKIEDVEKLLMYPLKSQETLEESSYSGISHAYANELWIRAKQIQQEKIKYIEKKELKEETRSNTWNNLVTFLNSKIEIDPRWELLIQQSDDPDFSEDSEYLGKIKDIRKASLILGPMIIDHYIDAHDCDVPWNINKLIYKFLLQKRLILSRDLYFILDK